MPDFSCRATTMSFHKNLRRFKELVLFQISLECRVLRPLLVTVGSKTTESLFVPSEGPVGTRSVGQLSDEGRTDHDPVLYALID